MDARPHDLPFEPATLNGLSEKLIRSHHQNNYGGAVKRLNAIRAKCVCCRDFQLKQPVRGRVGLWSKAGCVVQFRELDVLPGN